jgi:hypothetical protein
MSECPHQYLYELHNLSPRRNPRSFGPRTGAADIAEAVALQRTQRVPLVVAYGAGVDSTAILVQFARLGIRPDAILFADVGNENPYTYAYLTELAPWLAEQGFPPVTTVTLGTITSGRKETAGQKYRTLEEQCLLHETLPALAFGGRRGCSQKWKHEPQNRWVRSWKPAQSAWRRGYLVTKFIGYDSGPVDVGRPDIPSDAEYSYLYPLREWGWDRVRCQKEIAAEGLPVPPKSACFFCPSSKPWEIRQWAEIDPELLRRIIRAEATAEPFLWSIEGLWGKGVAGFRGATKKPGSMTEYIVGEELLPEFKGIGRGLAPPWWQAPGKVTDRPRGFSPSAVVHLVPGAAITRSKLGADLLAKRKAGLEVKFTKYRTKNRKNEGTIGETTVGEYRIIKTPKTRGRYRVTFTATSGAKESLGFAGTVRDGQRAAFKHMMEQDL